MMNKFLHWIALIILFNHSVVGQTVRPLMDDIINSGISGEELKLYTDRHLYCAGESIFFTAAYSFSGKPGEFSWSNVLYVELITWNGTRLAQMKVNLDNPGASGQMKIPDELLSGNYYLRAYTKWMRNYPANEYAYRPVKIVNPFLQETDKGPDTLPLLTEKDTCKEIVPGSEVICRLDKMQYEPGEKATLDVSLSDHTISGNGRYYVSVAKKGTIDINGEYRNCMFNASCTNDVRFLPEINGITLSGRVVNPSDGSPLKAISVSLSEPGMGAYFSIFNTTGNGEFFFTLPWLHGQYDFVIQAESADSIPVKIVIDDEFCSRPVNLPYIAFSLNDDEAFTVREMTINKQITSRFSSNSGTKDEKPEGMDSIPFYGSRKIVYLTDDYIELPNIEEFLLEVVYNVHIKRKKGTGSILNSVATALSNYPPLVLIDNVHMYDYKQLLKTPLNKIERVEVINQGYIAGNMKYNGLISIYSRNRDFAGVDLSQNSVFFHYHLFSENPPAYFPQKNASGSRNPFRSNLAYWNPDLQFNTKTSISFDIPDTPGEYVILIGDKFNPHIIGKCHFRVN